MTISNFKSRLRFCLALSLAVFFAATAQPLAAQTADGTLDPGFNPLITGTSASVRAVLAQPDGKILIGGSFVQTGETLRRNIARLNADGTPDATFDPGSGANGAVTVIALAPNNKIVIAGGFTVYNGVARSGVARINADGSLDTSFNPNSDANSNNLTNAFGASLVVQPDGKVLLGNNPSLVFIGGTEEPKLVRLNQDGSRDAAFNQNSVAAYKASALAIALQTDGKILVGGFSTAVIGGAPPKNFARLNQDGTLDASFDLGSGFNNGAPDRPGTITKIVVQSDNKILVGGRYFFFRETEVKSFVRLNPNGTLETIFSAPAAGAGTVTISDFVLQPNNQIVVASSFINVNTSERSLRRLNQDGTPDASFAPPDSAVFAANLLALQPDGKILLTGGTTLPFINGAAPQILTRLDQSGGVDNSFLPIIRGVGTISSILPQPDGKIIIGGTFARVANTARVNIARLNSDGSLDTNFNASINQIITSDIALQADNKILVGGASFSFFGSPNTSIVRLNQDGSNDASFQSPLRSGAQVTNILVQSDNKILLLGLFPIEDGVFPTAQTVVRLNPNGSIDNSFNATAANADLNPAAIALQTDGKILIGGAAANSSGSTAAKLRRVSPSGELDQSFNPSLDIRSVSALEALPDNRILVGGSIITADVLNSAGLARLNPDGAFDNSFGTNGKSTAVASARVLKLQPDGKILFSGLGQRTFQNGNVIGAVSSGIFGRLNVNGFEDNSFPRRFVGVQTIELQADNRVLVGGTFDSFDNQPAFSVARLNNRLRARSTRFDFDGDARADIAVWRPANGVWYQLRSNTNNSFAAANWGLPNDKLAPADYDGDGRTDLAIWRDEPGNPDRANFYIVNSLDNTVRIEQLGRTGDVPASGDWDGDGLADLAVYRQGASVGANSVFYYRPSAQPGTDFRAIAWGSSGDRFALGDFDGDGKQDAAVFRPSNGVWYILQSLDNQPRYVQFGLSSDKLTPADFDGDSKTDVAVFRDGVWYILNSTTNQPRYEYFGLANDTPIPADYDGDNRADVAVYRNGEWYLQRSQQGFAGLQFGVNTDAPIPAAFLR